MKYQIECTYLAGPTATVELPDGKTWDDVASWYVKWDTMNIVFKDGTELNEDLNSTSLEVVDWKRPTSVSIYAIDPDGKTNYEKEIANES